VPSKHWREAAGFVFELSRLPKKADFVLNFCPAEGVVNCVTHR
jgi:hypothetical protein